MTPHTGYVGTVSGGIYKISFLLTLLDNDPNIQISLVVGGISLGPPIGPVNRVISGNYVVPALANDGILLRNTGTTSFTYGINNFNVGGYMTVQKL